jgi:hypothetical protein
MSARKTDAGRCADGRVTQMSEIDKRKLTAKIVKSKELTALEKRYLEELIKRDNERRAQHVDKTDC